MTPRRIMVTGVGRPMIARFARRLAARDDVELVVGVDAVGPPRPGKAEFLRADLDNPVVGAALVDRGIDTLVHAGVHSQSRVAGGRRRLKEHNVIGTMHLLAVAQHAPDLQTVILKSSTAVYGSSAEDPAHFTERHPSDRHARGFGRDMVDVEGYAVGLARRRDDLDVMTFRFANFIGGADDAALAGFFRLPVVPSVLGWDPRLQFCHADDAVAVLTQAVFEPRRGTFNVAGPGTLYLSQAIRRAGRGHALVPGPLVEATASLLVRAGRVDVPIDQLSFLRFGRVVDVTKLVEQFGYVPRWTTTEAFDAFLAARASRGLGRQDLLALGTEVRERLRRPVA
ncbi:MAG TPA: NAD-dependent epimerase/dehydratase family protein [Nitriliruptoraceae bacterium]|nr:NAD-dependent epimerase/dehydratase family protein [Nitriliruptoraceae bacterium]